MHIIISFEKKWEGDHGWNNVRPSTRKVKASAQQWGKEKKMETSAQL